MQNKLLTLLFTSLFVIGLSASNVAPLNSFGHVSEISDPDTLLRSDTSPTDTSDAENFRKEKIITAILAFPIPFGFTGLHRIYLGSEPWVPVAYLISGGGGCGLLPLLDFIFIITANEEEFRSYENNPKFFMWMK